MFGGLLSGFGRGPVRPLVSFPYSCQSRTSREFEQTFSGTILFSNCHFLGIPVTPFGRSSFAGLAKRVLAAGKAHWREPPARHTSHQAPRSPPQSVSLVCARCLAAAQQSLLQEGSHPQQLPRLSARSGDPFGPLHFLSFPLVKLYIFVHPWF